MNALRPTVLVVDDHDLVATALTMALHEESVNAERIVPRSVAEILTEAAARDAGLVLLDLDLGWDEQRRRLDGLPAVAPLVQDGRHVIILSGTTDRARLGAAIAAGALAWLPKRAPIEHLKLAVRAAFDGAPVMDPAAKEALVQMYEAQAHEQRSILERLQRLSVREREVLADLAEGMRAQAIADKSVVSLTTVRTQIRGILTKLEVGSQLEAVALLRKVHKM